MASVMDPQEGQHHSIEEVEAALRALPDSYLLRLRRWAAWKLTDNCKSEADEVISEVFDRFVTGNRKWPHGVAFDTCFWNAVKSVISGEWDKHKRHAALHVTAVNEDGESEDPLASIGSNDGNPIELFEAAEVRGRRQTTIDHITGNFEADDAVTAVLIGIEHNLSPKEVQEQFELTETEYDSARRKLRRFLNKHYPNGWRSHGQRQQEPQSLA